MNWPPVRFASRWLKRAVRREPRCRFPVGDGANRVLEGASGIFDVGLDEVVENVREFVRKAKVRQRAQTYSMRRIIPIDVLSLIS
jgi:hypothetical protein